MSALAINTNLVGLAIAMLACLTATAQQPPDAPQKDTAAPTAPPEAERNAPPEAPAEEQISAEQALREAMEAAEMLEDAEGDEISGLLEQINTHSAIVHADNPINPWLDYLTGYAYAASGRKGDAIERLQSFVRTREGRNYWRAHRLLGDLLINSYPRLAKSSFIQARKLKKNEPTVLFGLSRCAASAGEFAAAVDLAEQVVSADGGKTLRYAHFLTELLIQAGRWDDAWRRARQAVEIAERDLAEGDITAGVDIRAKLQLLVAEIETSLEVLRGVIREDPGGEDAYMQMADLTHKKAETRARIAEIDKLKILEQGFREIGDRASPRLLESLAVALVEVGRTDDAIAAFQKLLLKDPSNPTATDWLNRLRQEKD